MSKLCLEQSECTAKCRSKGDAGRLIAVVTQDLPEDRILYHLATAGICSQPGKVITSSGRLLLHVAASVGKKNVVEWLLRFKEAAINAKDSESGYTALHRSVFSGQIAVAELLLSQGANAALCDHDGLTAFDHAVTDRQILLDLSPTNPCDVYAWGSNSNYNLGIGHQQHRQSPDVLEYFRREGVHVRKVVLQKFHSAFLSSSGQIFTCGHGRGGRLGHGNEESQLSPRPVKDLHGGQPCADVALGVDHSVFLTTTGAVLTCGTNLHHQLGQNPSPTESTSPQLVYLGKQIQKPCAVGVGASRFHSLFWTKDAVFTWGLNAGQLGHLKGDKTISQPKLVSSLNEKNVRIEMVSTSPAAIVVLTGEGEIIALHEYRTRRITVRQHGVAKIEVVGGHLDPKVMMSGTVATGSEFGYKLVERGGQDLKVFVLTKVGTISVWEEKRGGAQLFNCIFNFNREISVADIAVCGRSGGMLLISKDGIGFDGIHHSNKSATIGPKKKSREEDSELAQFVAKNQCDMIKLKRLPGVYRGAACATDPKGQNFCVLQVLPNASLYDIPDVSPSTIAGDMAGCLDQLAETDPTCDVVFVVSGRRFPAHRYVVANVSDKMSKMVCSAGEREVPLDDVAPEIFEQVLKYAYTKTCDLLKPGQCNVRVSTRNSPKDSNDACSSPELIADNPDSVSAFAVHNNGKSKRKNKIKIKNGKQQGTKDKNSNEVTRLEMLQAAARNLAIHGLTKAAENFRMSGSGLITLKDGGKPPRAALCFSRKSFPELHDVIIKTDDGEEISAHKCILSARLEYFRSMFGLGWIETGGGISKLSLPLPAKVVHAILDFLYRDEAAALVGSDETEFVCNVLVAADQFLMTRLIEVCERQLVQMLNLKNAAEMLQFAFDFSAKQLGRSAMQYLSQNMAVELESRVLAVLSGECMEKLTEYYRDSVPAMAKRNIKPYAMSTPMAEETMKSDDILKEEELFAAEAAAVAATTTAGAGKKRNRSNSSGEGQFGNRRDSASSNVSYNSDSGSDHGGARDSDGSSLDLDDFEFEERVKEEKMEKKEEAMVTRDAHQGDFLASFFKAKKEHHVEGQLQQNQPPVAVKKFSKKSQKERKRLSEQELKPEVQIDSKPKWSGWGATPSAPDTTAAMATPTTPLAVVMIVEAKSAAGARPKAPNKVRKASWRQLSFTEDASATSPPAASAAAAGNPWKQLPTPDPVAAKSPIANGSNFSQIVRSQVERREERRQQDAKSLLTLQMEELAMEELQKASGGNPLERVSVVRVEKEMDPPTWNWARNK
jgi:hypothetical protein